MLQHFRPIAYQGGSLDRACHLALLNQVGFARREHKLARSDIDLATAKIDGVDTLVNRGDDFLRVVLTGQHVGVGHAWHGQMCVGLAAPVTGGTHAHQTGIHPVLHVAFQNTVFDKHRVLSSDAFIINIQRTATATEGAVINDRTQRRSHLLPDHAGKGRGPLAIEVTFKTVADGLVQQDTRPAGTQHHRHGTRRRIDRIEVNQCLAHRLVRISPGTILIKKEAVIGAPATTGTGLFTATVLLDNDGHITTHQRPHIGCQRAITDGHHHDLVDTGQANDHFLDTRILLTRFGIKLFQQRHLVISSHPFQRIERRI